MNVLITSAGRRVGLVRAFQKAAAARGGRVVAGDVSALAPSLYVADEAVQLPPLSAGSYLAELCQAIQAHDIRLVVPTIDTELPLLAAASKTIHKVGCVVLISSRQFIDICNDKWLTVTVFGEHGVRVPLSWLPGTIDGTLPEKLFVKPRAGSASQHTYAVDRSEVCNVIPMVPDPIIQERLEGQEITVDALLDLNGTPIHYVPRKRIRTVGGESIQGITIDDAEIRSWMTDVLRIAGELGARGPITIQFFDTPGGPVLSEINPRFGGGFPLAYAAGANYPEWIMQMLEGHTVEPKLGQYKRGLVMTRYYEEIILETLKW